MFGRAFLVLCGIAGPTVYFMGGFDRGIDRVVGASPHEVREALMDLDIRNAPGEPGTDPSRSGGVEPSFHVAREGNDLVWSVMSGKDVAIRMIAHLEPVDGGKRTRVTADVARGNAPDDFVSPAFRSESLTLGLFSLVLEDELDDLVRPANADPTACQRIFERFEASAPSFHDQAGFGAVAKMSIRLHALDSELKAAGCETGFKKFHEMGPAMTDPGGPSGNSSPEVSFEPGQPMTDLSIDR
jgi:hypothetical protein